MSRRQYEVLTRTIGDDGDFTDDEPETSYESLTGVIDLFRGPADSDHAKYVHVGTDHEGRVVAMTVEYDRWTGPTESYALHLFDVPKHSAARLVRLIRSRACI